MPDAQGNYLGDQATVLPDNTQNIIHYADQYQAANQRRAMLRQKQAEDDQRRNESYLKLIGDAGGEIDNTDNNAGQKLTSDSLANLKSQEIKNYQNSVRKGIPINEAELRDRLNLAVNKISNTHNAYVNKEQEANDNIASYAGVLGVDHDKLNGLSKLELNYSTDPKTGKTILDPNKVNDNRKTSDVVKNVFEDNFDTIANGQGIGKHFAEGLGKGPSMEQGVQPILDNNGQVVSPGFTAKIKNYQEFQRDAKGNPMGLQVRQVPALTSDGTIVKNQDGSTKMTIAPDLAKDYLGDLGQSINLKKESYHAILDENKKRSNINEMNQGVPGFKPMAMITGDSEEAHAIQNDLILKKYQEAQQGGEFKEAPNKNWENRLKMNAQAISQGHLNLSRAEFSDRKMRADNKEAKDAAPINDVYGKLDNIITESSPEKGLLKVNALPQDIQAEAMKAATSYDKDIKPSDIYIKKTASGDVFLMKGDPNNILNTDTHITQFTPTATNLLGKGNTGKAQKEAILANEKKPNMIQRGIQKVKEAVTGKSKTTIEKGSL